MARTDLTVTDITRAGVDQATTLEAANIDGEAFLNNGETWLLVKNTNVTSCTVTIKTNGRTVQGLALPDDTVAVAQNEEQLTESQLLPLLDTYLRRKRWEAELVGRCKRRR